jgi:SAM-dependent methyltransferase
MEELSGDARRNRAFWDGYAAEYQDLHREQLAPPEPAWGMWQLPERELRILGDVTGRDVLELGCGAAQWAIMLAQRGARMVGLDNSEAQLAHARENMAAAGVDFPLVHASAESTPFADASFDVVFCDHGALSFADPHRVVPEAARILRPGGTLAFSALSTLQWLFVADADEPEDEIRTELVRDYFGLHRLPFADGSVDFALPYGEWIRLFVRSGLEVVDLVEIQPPPGATSTYRTERETAWARRWPMEQIWVTRRRAAG